MKIQIYSTLYYFSIEMVNDLELENKLFFNEKEVEEIISFKLLYPGLILESENGKFWLEILDEMEEENLIDFLIDYKVLFKIIAY